MTVGTTDGATSARTDDQVLQSALAEMASEGYNAEGPANDGSPQDATSAAAGLTPAAPAPTHTPGDDGIPGQADATPSALAQAASPTDPPAPQESADPLDGAEPFTYTVDGQSRTMDGVFRIPNEGIIVPEEQVPRFQLMASRAESLEQANRALYQKTSDYERVAQWTTAGPDGTRQVLTGTAALEAQQVTLGRALAALDTLSTALRDPQHFAALIAVDANGNVIPDPTALQHLLTRAELAEVNAERMVRAHVQSLLTQSAAPSHTTPQASDLAQIAPVVIQSLATQESVSLSAEDRTFLAEQLPRYLRSATPQDVALNPALSVGESVVDHAFTALVKRTASQPTGPTAATTAATKFNAAQAKGRQALKAPPAAPPTPRAATSAQPPSRTAGKQAAWDSLLQSALTEIGS